MSKQFLHVILADEKHAKNIRVAFEQVFPDASDYWVFEGSRKIKYPTGITVFERSPSSFAERIKKLGGYRIIFVHCLTFPAALIALNAPEDCQIVWRLWGTDYCNRREFQQGREFLGPATQRVWERRHQSIGEYLRSKRIPSRLTEMYLRLKYGIAPSDAVDKFLRRVKFVAPVVPTEIDLIRARLPISPNVQMVSFPYGSVEEMFGNIAGGRVSGNAILLGNSASYTNNHIEALEMLSRLKIGNRRVIAPLSYGNAHCRREVVNAGDKMLENFCPITALLPTPRYIELLSSCSVVVMNHYRQEAHGNVMIALWLGARVFMAEQSPVYQYFKREGYVIFSTRDLSNTDAGELTGLESPEIETNKRLLMTVFGRSSIAAQIRDTVDRGLRVPTAL